MRDLIDRISEIAGKICSIEDNRKKLGLFLRDVSEQVEFTGNVLEKKMIHKVKDIDVSGKVVVGVDGGLSKHSYHGIDLILTRAIAAVFRYDSKLKVEYYPNAFVSPKLIIVSDPYSDEEFIISSSLERHNEEVRIALEVAEKIKPDVILMDGSIVPHGSDKPSIKSLNRKHYENLSKNLVKLYSSGQMLAGCIEDSRGRGFCEIISKQVLSNIEDPYAKKLGNILEGTRDTNLLYYLLRRGERSFVFRYSRDAMQHPVLSDLGGWGDRIYSFYIKTAEFDRPVRVDFVSNNPLKDAEKIAEFVLATACHSSYGIPAPIIEADLRAKLSERDADEIHGQLIDKLGLTPSLMKLRRDQRPF